LTIQGQLNCDRPKSILSAKLQNNELYFLIEWGKRLDNTTPKPTFYTKSEIQNKYPDLLINYYKTKIKLD